MRKPIKIKDPIYGYIEIDDEKVYSIINSSAFHRLQDIIQTSYSSVYPSSLHNRFIHSIGVYYLGNLALKAIEHNNKDILPNDFESLKDIFLLACLLHDLGHAPFSHTGEKYYFLKQKDKIPLLRIELQNIVNNDEYSRDDNEILAGAPHELMSALEGLVLFHDYIPDDSKSFFVRCITGLKYKDKTDIRNCLIELLNSKTIDVDKLDYLIRDSYYTGFKTLNIDYHRLLSAVYIFSDNNSNKSLGFTKAALSTLESVILAHDMERKWIQNHPTIQYENQLLNAIIQTEIDKYNTYGIDLFSLDSLTEKGSKGMIRICNDKKEEFLLPVEVRLLSDSDIIAFMKSDYSNKLVQEYFNRALRKKALWKSESEYRILFEQGDLSPTAIERLESKFDSIIKTYTKNTSLPIIDDNLLNYVNKEIQKIQETDLPQEIKKAKIKEFSEIKFLLENIKDFSNKNSYSFEYVLISNKQFYSSFNKAELKNIQIKFDNGIVNPLGKSINLFEQKEPREKFFYIYVNPKDRNDFDVRGFCRVLHNCAFNHFNEYN